MNSFSLTFFFYPHMMCVHISYTYSSFLQEPVFTFFCEKSIAVHAEMLLEFQW